MHSERHQVLKLLLINLLITKMCVWKLSLVIAEIVLIISYLSLSENYSNLRRKLR